MRMCGTSVEGGEAAGADRSGAGTYTSRPALAELTSRTIRSRRHVPQPHRYPGTAALWCRDRSGTAGRPGTVSVFQCPLAPCPHPVLPVPRPPRAQLGGRRRVGAGSARRLLLKPDPAPPSAPLSPRRPHPRPATGARRRSAAPGRGPRRWVDVVGHGTRRGRGAAARRGGLRGAGGKAAAGRDKEEWVGSNGRQKLGEVRRGGKERGARTRWEGTGQGRGWAKRDGRRRWVVLEGCGDAITEAQPVFQSTTVPSLNASTVQGVGAR